MSPNCRITAPASPAACMTNATAPTCSARISAPAVPTCSTASRNARAPDRPAASASSSTIARKAARWAKSRNSLSTTRASARKAATPRPSISSAPNVSPALSLLNARAVRERAHRLLAIGLDDRLPHFRIQLDRMDSTVELVLKTTREAYPAFDVPFHSRWRHFVANGDNRWADIAGRTEWPDRAARARAEFDLAIVSVFLDAGAGPSWRYHDPLTGSAIGRSEGLGLARLPIFADRRV